MKNGEVNKFSLKSCPANGVHLRKLSKCLNSASFSAKLSRDIAQTIAWRMIMFLSKLCFVAGVATLALSGLFAKQTDLTNLKKHYIDEKAICITKDGISVKTKDGFAHVKTLRHDKNGFYTLAQDIKKDMRYYCRRCKTYFRSNEELRNHYCRPSR